MGWHQKMDDMSDEEIAKSGLSRERLKEILPDEPIPLSKKDMAYAQKVIERLKAQNPKCLNSKKPGTT